VTGKPVPDIKFFNMTEFTIAGKQVRALRHGMAGQPGFELFGPWADGDLVREALIEAGKDYGMRLVGARAYSSNTLESGWIPSPLPAVYTGEKMKAYREWLGANSYEATGSLGGSFVSENIEDYYLTPYDLTYGAFVKFDHEYPGKEALQKLNGAGRKKVTLELNSDDVIKAIGTMAATENRAKFWDWPSAVYSTWPYDRVLKDGKTIGVSTWVGYTQNFGKFLTLAMLAPEHATPGTEVTFEWGEPNSTRPTVEKHVVTQLRAVVQPTPYSDVARVQYASGGGWRAGK
jgi:syringate O-demethylase